jgi:hypothetical protein
MFPLVYVVVGMFPLVHVAISGCCRQWMLLSMDVVVISDYILRMMI